MKSLRRLAVSACLLCVGARVVTAPARSANTTDAVPSAVPIPGTSKVEVSPVSKPAKKEALEKEEEERWRKRDALAETQWPKWKTLIQKFRALQKRRAEALAGSQKARNQHIAALRALFRQAQTLNEDGRALGVGDYDEWMITFNTELANFGIDDPNLFHWNNNDDAQVEPQTLVDPKTHVTYKLKADGQHVVAISTKGKILWSHNVLDDAWIPPYRFSKPVITVFQLSADSPEEYEKHQPFSYWEGNYYSWRVVEVGFNSSQFGYIDAVTGKFHFLGQN